MAETTRIQEDYQVGITQKLIVHTLVHLHDRSTTSPPPPPPLPPPSMCTHTHTKSHMKQ